MDYIQRTLLGKKKIEELGDSIAGEVYRLLNITPEQAENGAVRIVDEKEEDGLYLLHYINPLSDVYHIRGTVISVGTSCIEVTDGIDINPEVKIVCQSFPFIEEFNEADEKFDEIIDDIYSPDVKLYYGYKVTVIRVFKCPMTGQWYFSTHKRIDGTKSRWSGATFAQMFHELWGEEHFDNYLSDDRTYVFLVSHPDNRLVCRITEPELRLIGEFRNDNSGNRLILEDEYSMKKEHPNVKVSGPIQGVADTKAELIDELYRIDTEVHSGMIIENNGVYSRFTPCQYSNLRELRGNEPNLRLRYLILRIDEGDNSMADNFVDLFSERRELFEETEKEVKKLPKHLTKYYVGRYIQRRYIRLPPEEHYIVETARQCFNEKLSIQKNIERMLETSSARQINGMIKRMREGTVVLTTE
jgi:hypothetical protein